MSLVVNLSCTQTLLHLFILYPIVVHLVCNLSQISLLVVLFVANLLGYVKQALWSIFTFIFYRYELSLYPVTDVFSMLQFTYFVTCLRYRHTCTPVLLICNVQQITLVVIFSLASISRRKHINSVALLNSIFIVIRLLCNVLPMSLIMTTLHPFDMYTITDFVGT